MYSQDHRSSRGTGFGKFRAYLVPGLLLAFVPFSILQAVHLPPGLAEFGFLLLLLGLVAQRQGEIL
jgi:hypothetical protein